MSSIVALPIQFSTAQVDDVLEEPVEVVEETNSAPVLNFIGFNSEDENNSAELTLFAKDPDPHDTLTYTSSALPSFVTLEDKGDKKSSINF